jgi:hypothetical protein
MFVKRQVTETDRLRKAIRQLDGKSTKDKFRNLLKQMQPKLDKIEAFERYFDQELNDNFKRIKEDYKDLIQTTSSDSVLESMILCHEDLEQLLDDMLHGIDQGSYDQRLRNILAFLKDFQNASYQRQIKFFDESSSKFTDQLSSIAKDIQAKVSKMTYQVKQLTDEILTLEKENVKLVKKMEETSKESFEYKDYLNKIQGYHQTIELNSGTISMVNKTMNSYRLLANLFSQLAVLDEYLEHLKTDSYIRKLVKRLYRKPQELDVLENTVDLADAVKTIQEEIIKIESVVKPAQRMIFEDLNDDADDNIINKYKSMAK